MPHGVLAARRGVAEGEDDNSHSRLRLSLSLKLLFRTPPASNSVLAFNPHASKNGGESEVPCTLYGCHTHLCNGSCDPCCLKAAFEYFQHGAARHLSGIRCALCPPPRPEGIRFTMSLEFDVAGVRGKGCTVLHSCAASRWSVRRGGVTVLFYCNCCSSLSLT